jgi:hypothetical protein
MTTTANSGEAVIIDRAKQLKQWLTLLVIGLAVLMLLEFAGAAGLTKPGSAETKLEQFGLQLLFAAPALLHLCALWSVLSALAAIGRGDLFAPTVAKALSCIGMLLMAGAAVSVFLLPLLHKFAAGSHPRLIELDVTNIVLGGLGLSLVLLAKLFANADAMRRELNEIF